MTNIDGIKIYHEEEGIIFFAYVVGMVNMDNKFQVMATVPFQETITKEVTLATFDTEVEARAFLRKGWKSIAKCGYWEINKPQPADSIIAVSVTDNAQFGLNRA